MMSASSLLNTPLHAAHLALNAKMVPFAGFEMPVSYSGIKAEHLAVRTACGLFDVSHMGEFVVSGSGALDFLERMTTNQVSSLFPGRVQYSCMPNGKGGIVDDLLVYNLAPDSYMLVVNAGNLRKDWDWLTQKLPSDQSVVMENRSESTALLALQGPRALDILQPLCDADLSGLGYYHFTHAVVAGIDSVLVSATGYTGAGGFELYVPSTQAQSLWDALMRNGESFGLLPCGLGCRDTLRLEMGFCLYGNDIDEETSPIEAGLSWITSFEKEFVDKEYLLQQKKDGPSRKLMGFVMEERGIPRQGYLIRNEAGEVIGKVTSGSESISTGRFVGMGYVGTPYAIKGQRVSIEIRDRQMSARLVRPPFI
jgi:aminomethyltransferase